MVIKAPRRTGLGVTAGPDAQVDGVDRMTVGDGILSQRRAQGIDIEATRSQRVIDAAPPAAMQWLQVIPLTVRVVVLLGLMLMGPHGC